MNVDADNGMRLGVVSWPAQCGKLSQVRALAPRPRAQIDDSIARTGIDDPRHQLRTLVLHLEVSFFVSGKPFDGARSGSRSAAGESLPGSTWTPAASSRAASSARLVRVRLTRIVTGAGSLLPWQTRSRLLNPTGHATVRPATQGGSEPPTGIHRIACRTGSGHFPPLTGQGAANAVDKSRRPGFPGLDQSTDSLQATGGGTDLRKSVW